MKTKGSLEPINAVHSPSRKKANKVGLSAMCFEAFFLKKIWIFSQKIHTISSHM
jgi:hypothetical protein